MITLNQQLVTPYSREVSESFPDGPYVAEFAQGRKRLHYVAATHTCTAKDKNGNIISHTHNPTMALIDEQLAKSQPDFVIFEMPDRMNAQNPTHPPEKLGDPEYERQLLSEAAYGSYHAQRLGIPYTGAEPAEEVMLDEMQKKGYHKHDIAYFYALRHIPNITQGGKADVDEATIAAVLNEKLQLWHKELGFDNGEVLDYDGLKQWFSYHNKDPGHRLPKTRSGDFAPLHHGSFFQRMSADTGDIREQNLNRKIEEALNKYDKVMVIYGGGHLAQSYDVYADVLGAAEFSRSMPQRLLEMQTQEHYALQKLQLSGSEADRKQWQKLCVRNLNWISDYVERHGWPSEAKYGEEVALAAFLMVQHGDGGVRDPAIAKKQARLLEKMEEARAKPAYIAFVTDRIRHNQGKAQIYGTVPYDYPIADAEKLESWRQSAGLAESHEAYLARMAAGDKLPLRSVIEQSPSLLAKFQDTELPVKRIAGMQVSHALIAVTSALALAAAFTPFTAPLAVAGLVTLSGGFAMKYQENKQVKQRLSVLEERIEAGELPKVTAPEKIAPQPSKLRYRDDHAERYAQEKEMNSSKLETVLS